MFGRSDKSISKEEVISSFTKEIARQEDIVYGVALFFECLNVIHENQLSVLETHRKQFRNLIQNGNDMISDASDALRKAQRTPEDVTLLKQFEFQPCQGHPKPQEMTRRAEALVQTYHRIFPNRPRSKEFSREETLKLLEETSELFSPAAPVRQ